MGDRLFISRLSYVTDAENDETHYAYDDAGNLTSVTDANNHATSYTYNENNWLTRIDYPDSTYESFTYYDTGALETRTDGNGVTTAYDRDELDRVTTIDYPGTASDVTFEYDEKGRVTRMQDGNCDTYYRYDIWGITKYRGKGGHGEKGDRLSISVDRPRWAAYHLSDAAIRVVPLGRVLTAGRRRRGRNPSEDRK